MTNLFDPRTLSKMERLDLVARFVVEGFFSGRHMSPYRGFSTDFSQHRAYVPGDDTRRVDWKAYGRTERYYLREYQQETTLTAHILIDTSKSMAYSSGQLRKIEYAKMAAACLAYLVLDQQDTVSVMTFDSDIRPAIAPTSRMAALSDICEALMPIEPSGAGDVPAALHRAAELLVRRGVIVIISDLLSDPDATLKGLQHLSFAGHDCLAVQVLDHAERTFPFSGACVFKGLERGGRVFTDAGRLRKRYVAAMDAFQARLRQGCIAAQVDYLLADTSTDLDKILSAYLLSRGRHR
jgi:uncharacterized protein (DUF58 family)